MVPKINMHTARYAYNVDAYIAGHCMYINNYLNDKSLESEGLGKGG
jgi:hypothetical protein